MLKKGRQASMLSKSFLSYFFLVDRQTERKIVIGSSSSLLSDCSWLTFVWLFSFFLSLSLSLFHFRHFSLLACVYLFAVYMAGFLFLSFTLISSLVSVCFWQLCVRLWFTDCDWEDSSSAGLLFDVASFCWLTNLFSNLCFPSLVFSARWLLLRCLLSHRRVLFLFFRHSCVWSFSFLAFFFSFSFSLSNSTSTYYFRRAGKCISLVFSHFVFLFAGERELLREFSQQTANFGYQLLLALFFNLISECLVLLQIHTDTGANQFFCVLLQKFE